MNLQHIRVKLPNRGGNSFYKDTRDFSHLAKTLCGAAITDKDVDIRTGKSKAWITWPTACQDCLNIVKGLPELYVGC